MKAMKPADEALSQILDHVRPSQPHEQVPLLEALGRILAVDQVATLNVPPSDNSAMDGYAFCHDDLAALAPDQGLEISQRIPAGTVPKALTKGTAARIFTGAEIPEGADSVVMQEQCRPNESDTQVIIPGDCPKGNNIRRAGQDIAKGSVIAAAGDLLSPQTIGLLASIGIAQVPVYRQLRVAILSTGDELAEPGTPLQEGQIYNSNRYLLASLLQQMHLTVVDLGRVDDTPAATLAALSRATLEADIIISTGGVSVGEEDHVKGAVEKLGELNLWKLAIKPGKPLAFGRVGDTPFFGLPGNPVSTFVTFLLFARPYLQKMQGMEPKLPSGSLLPASFARSKPSIRQEYVRVKVDDDGNMHTHPNQSSGVLSSTSWSNALAIVPADTRVELGQAVRVVRYDQLF
ncbi:MAG: molybdopterin molybdotransferase MoeA [Cellvibrionaceae bacterium]